MSKFNTTSNLVGNCTTSDYVLDVIDDCCMEFLKSLVKIDEQHDSFVVLSNPYEINKRQSKELKLTIKSCRSVAQMLRAVAMIYQLRVSGCRKTKRDLFYEQKLLFGEQRNFNNSIQRIHDWLGVDASAGYVMASGHGLVIGPLKIHKDTGIVDCSLQSTIIEDFSGVNITTTAQCILVVEKDATFQKLINEEFLELFPHAILVTGKGYPDIATRILLSKLGHLEVFGLLDCDPHAPTLFFSCIEIAMTYKYGSQNKIHDSKNLKLPGFEWIGLSRNKLPKFVINIAQFLPLQQREWAKLSKLWSRIAVVKNEALLEEVELMYKYGNKLELEAVSGITPRSMCQYLLRTKISKYATAEKQLT
ncbi:unnamed protein product [Thelazia callipaeda]|uniref:DNA topoisomerase (ATP-hydrolyzing) n=1 Tax=Thelazia callipaeda TaxID=103827 RepID=A0A0N5CNQ6_THECL|nr:unnamed protein product [Thelazia callipaeda]